MRPTVCLPAAGLALCVALTGCTSSSSRPTTPPSSTAASPSPSATGTPVTPGPLATRLQGALDHATTAHLALSTAVKGGSTIRGSGDVTLRDGTIWRADITEALPGGLGSVRLVVAGGRTYAKLPSGLAPKVKPWAVLSTSSTQPLVAQLAGTVGSVLAVASPASVVTFVRAASSVRDLGTAAVDGTTARHYRVIVAATKLASLPGGLSAGGASSVPIDLYTDRTGRPVRLRGSLVLGGAHLTPTVTLSGYDRPVSIAAPPASRVSG